MKDARGPGREVVPEAMPMGVEVTRGHGRRGDARGPGRARGRPTRSRIAKSCFLFFMSVGVPASESPGEGTSTSPGRGRRS